MSSEVISRLFSDQYIEALVRAADKAILSLSRFINDFDLVLNAIPKQSSTTNDDL